ncbi:MAG TPA: hypothetical protein P5523_05845, partial [Bacteroidales bacterium]|nr:hypothetical protein [Bacteroidales bacterium]
LPLTVQTLQAQRGLLQLSKTISLLYPLIFGSLQEYVSMCLIAKLEIKIWIIPYFISYFVNL